MREGFHARDGWYFRRSGDGSVVIEVAESAHEVAPLRVAVSLDPDTWASVVASVSARGENSGTFYAAQNLHFGEPVEPKETQHVSMPRDFSVALSNIKDGAKLTRAGWNAPDQWVVIQKGYPDGIAINRNTAEATGIPEGTVCVFRPYLMLRTADGSFVPWAPTVSDVLAEDWYVVE